MPSPVLSDLDDHAAARRHRRRLLAAIAVPALFAAFFAAFMGGSCRTTARPQTLMVTGPSMAPTLWGPHASGPCPACRAAQTVHWQPPWRPDRWFICWNCSDRVPTDALTAQPADSVVCHVQPPIPANAGAQWRVGDLVAVQIPVADSQWPQGEAGQAVLSVKRVAALPGQSINVAADGWLLIDSVAAVARDSQNQPLWLPVHDSQFRGDDPPRWRLFHEPTSWLRYHHLAVYQNLQPDVPRDDFPANAAESRTLRPISDLRLTFQTTADADATVEVVFQLGESVWTFRQPIAAGTHDHAVTTLGTSPDATGADSPVPTTPQIPIALRIVAGAVQLDQLVVWRPIRYRISPADGSLPQSVPDGHLLLLGDNVPLSIDSRQWGCVPFDRIVGRMDPVR